jgi:hypothetical protein
LRVAGGRKVIMRSEASDVIGAAPSVLTFAAEDSPTQLFAPMRWYE